MADLIEQWELDTDQFRQAAKGRRIVVFDDVLTTGASFKAAQSMIGRCLTCHPVFGLFVARRKPEDVTG